MKQCAAVLIILLLVLALSACGDDGPSSAPQAPATTATPQAADDAAPAGGESAPEAELPAAEPTAVPPPTDPPPTETAASQAASGPGWGASNTTAQTACDNPYFPLRKGYRYTMSDDTGSEISWAVLNVQGDLKSATAEMQMSLGDFTSIYHWQCSQEDGLVSFEFAGQGLGGLEPNMAMELVRGEGVFLPPAGAIAPGYTWESTFASNVTFNTSEAGVDVAITGAIDTHQVNTVVNTEPVAFDGRSLPGFLLHQDTDMNMAMTAMDNTIENEMSFAGETQFAYGIGMIRNTAFTDFGDFSSEMVEYFVP